MKHWYMLTLIGKDQPNIVAQLTSRLYQAGCTLGEANMNRLGGNFTVMLMVKKIISKVELTKLLQPVVEQFQLSLHLTAIEGDLHQHQCPNVCVRAYGADRLGIVAQVTGALAQQGFNILDLSSDVGGTTAQPFYVLQIEGHSARNISELQQAVAHLTDIQVELTAIDDECII